MSDHATNVSGALRVSVVEAGDGSTLVTIRPELSWIRAVIYTVGVLAFVASTKYIGLSRRGSRPWGTHQPSVFDIATSDRMDVSSLAVRGFAYACIVGLACAALWNLAGARVLHIAEDAVTAQLYVFGLPVWAAKRVPRTELTHLRVEVRRHGRNTESALVYGARGAEHTLVSGISPGQAHYLLAGPLRAVTGASSRKSRKKR